MNSEQLAGSKEQRVGNKRSLSLLTAHCSLLAVLLSLFLLSSCDFFFTPPMYNPAGEGTFTLQMGGLNVGRTILPTTAQGDFAAYTLEFTSGGKSDVTEYRTNADLGNDVTLEAGTWNLTVTAYMDSGPNPTKPAARGTLNNIVINSGSNTSRNLELKAIIDEGTGTFAWDVVYPDIVTYASMNITPLDEDTGTPDQSQNLSTSGSGSMELNAGYYRLTLYLNTNGGERVVQGEEYLHIYQNMTSHFTSIFTKAHFTVLSVTHGGPEGQGSLRYAIEHAESNNTILIEEGIEIRLNALYGGSIAINKNLTIDGNGVRIDGNTADSIFEISGSGVNVKLSRMHFKNGQINSSGANLTIESSIIDDRVTVNQTGGSVTIKGSTLFYDMPAISLVSGVFTIEGNLFYSGGGRAIDNQSGTVHSLGYNVIDIPLGTGNGQSGWVPATGDTTFAELGIKNYTPFNTATFAPVYLLRNVIPSVPTGFPAMDFNGDARTYPGAPGAVRHSNETDPFVPVTNILFEDSSNPGVNITTLDMRLGSTKTLKAKVVPADATYQTVTWTSGNSAIVEVDENGVVTAKALTTAINITAAVGKVEDDNYTTATCSVTVNNDGGGTAEDPKVITSEAEFLEFMTDAAVNLDKHYKLYADIVLTQTGGTNWTAIGSKNFPFTGSFDGNGHSISGMVINLGQAYQGLFGNIGTDGVVKNVHLVDVSITQTGTVTGTGDSAVYTGDNAGGIAAWNDGLVQNCSVTGTVTGVWQVGGIVGHNEGKVWNCYSGADVTVTSATNLTDPPGQAGGIVGRNRGQVFNCYSTGNVSGVYSFTTNNADAIGGIVGRNQGAVQYCYATGSVNGRNGVGGITGDYLTNSPSPSIQNSVALNREINRNSGTQTATVFGRIVGVTANGTQNYNYGRNPINANPSLTISSSLSSKDGLNITATEWESQSWWQTTVDFNFTQDWDWHPVSNLPILKGIPANIQNPLLDTTVVKGATLTDKLATLQTTAVSNGNYLIEVSDNETIDSIDLSGMNNVTITLIGIGGERIISLASSDSTLFTVGGSGANNVTLILDNNITLQGRSDNTQALVAVVSGGTLIMNEGSQIKGNTSDSITGGVNVSNGTFIMNGGTISGNTTSQSSGGGVRVQGSGTFIMNGGTISGNSAPHADFGNGGGVYVSSGTTFTMNGGIISGNTAGHFGGGVHVEGTFKMSNGTIYGSDEANASLHNTVAVGGAALNIMVGYGGNATYGPNGTGSNIIASGNTEDRTIEVVNGLLIKPAIPVDGTNTSSKLTTLSTMAESGGSYIIEVGTDEDLGPQTLSVPPGVIDVTVTLKGNGSRRNISLASNGSLFTVGSGVTLVLDDNITLEGRDDNGTAVVSVEAGGKLRMKAGSQITSNTASNGVTSGSGVNVYGSFVMDGGEIFGNNADYSNGGGVYVWNGGTFTMNGGIISGNKALNLSWGWGGGVYVASGGIFTMTGGEISGNEALNGGGVYSAGIFTMTGGEISGNKATGGGTTSGGGGVYVEAGGAFTKTGGTIYGTGEGANSNTTTSTYSNRGHAVYMDSSPTKHRETTAGPTVNMNSATAGTAGGWD